MTKRLGIDVRMAYFLGGPSYTAGAVPGEPLGVRSGPTGSAKRLETNARGTISNRVLRALSRLGAISGGPLDADQVPPTITQAGLSVELGIPRESFVRALLRLVDRQVVVQVRRRVEGSSRVQKVYLLTACGSEQASTLPA
ncbi:MAG TPA: hypothetical protein VEE83_05440 [Thermoplasmata archaeon]|nr:hypothetical protein [Thermoplasmata archaeon]